jgi:hypothetical protein
MSGRRPRRLEILRVLLPNLLAYLASEFCTNFYAAAHHISHQGRHYRLQLFPKPGRDHNRPVRVAFFWIAINRSAGLELKHLLAFTTPFTCSGLH